MNNEFSMTTGQAHEVAQAFGRNGWNNEQVKRLSEGNFLKLVLDVLLGRAEITYPEHLIDCDAPVFVPKNWSVLPDTEQLPNRVTGLVKFVASTVKLHLEDDQKNGKSMGGNLLRRELEKKRVYTAHVLDYLLKPENQHLIPEEWKGKAVFFWGTLYRDADGRLCVRCLHRNDNRWRWYISWLDGFWLYGCPAAVPVS